MNLLLYCILFHMSHIINQQILLKCFSKTEKRSKTLYSKYRIASLGVTAHCLKDVIEFLCTCGTTTDVVCLSDFSPELVC